MRILKNITAAMLACAIVVPIIPGAFAQTQNEQKLNAAVAEYNKSAKGTEFEIKEVPADVIEYVNSLPGDVEYILYKREIPDMTKTVNSGAREPIKLSDETLPWYTSAKAEDKRELFLNKLRMGNSEDGSSYVFSDGYTVPLYGTFYSVLGNFVLGTEDNNQKLIDQGNNIIVENLGEDKSMVYHSDMKAWAFTDVTPYIIWYDYGDKLTEEARDALYRYISRIGTKTDSFCPAKASGEREFESFHNQQSEGLLMGLLYAEICGDDKMLVRMEEALDRTLSSMGTTAGLEGDAQSPGYGGFTYHNYYVAHRYVKNERIKAKLELLLSRYNYILAQLLHYPSNSIMGTFTRAYGCQYFMNAEKQNYYTFSQMALDGYVFAAQEESLGYCFWPANRAATEMRYPDYLQNLIKEREYPYESVSAVSLINETDYDIMHTHIGWLGDRAQNKRLTHKYMYATEEYNISSSPQQWHTAAKDGQNAPFRVNYRRHEKNEDIKDYSDIGSLWSMYLYDSDIAVNPEVAKSWASYNYPNGDGKQFGVQVKNKAIVFGWPGPVSSEPVGNNAGVTEEITDFGETMILTNREEASGIWYGDKFLFGEKVLYQGKTEEVRLKMSTSELPIYLKGDDKIYIEDFNTYIALQPLNTTDLGRTYDIGITDMGKAIKDCNQGATNAYPENYNILAITAYNYYGEKKKIELKDRMNQRNGFIVELADKAEYPTIADFKKHMENETSFEITDKPGEWTISYKSGEDTLWQTLDADNMQVIKGERNGEPVYIYDYKESDIAWAKSTSEKEPLNGANYGKWNRADFWEWLDSSVYKDRELLRTDEAVQSSQTEIKLGDATLKNPSGTMIFIMHEPKENLYQILNMANRTASFTLDTPEGTVSINNMNLGEVIYRPENKENMIEKNIVPGMTLLKTNVSVKQK